MCTHKYRSFACKNCSFSFTFYVVTVLNKFTQKYRSLGCYVMTLTQLTPKYRSPGCKTCQFHRNFLRGDGDNKIHTIVSVSRLLIDGLTKINSHICIGLSGFFSDGFTKIHTLVSAVSRFLGDDLAKIHAKLSVSRFLGDGLAKIHTKLSVSRFLVHGLNKIHTKVSVSWLLRKGLTKFTQNYRVLGYKKSKTEMTASYCLLCISALPLRHTKVSVSLLCNGFQQVNT